MAQSQSRTEYRAMLDAFERFDPDPYPKTHRTALELMVDDELLQELKDSLEISDLVPGGSPEKIRRMIAAANDFARLHHEAIDAGLSLGQERAKESLIDRLKVFMEIRVKRSKKKDKLTGEELLDSAGRCTFMGLRTLIHLRLTLCHLLDTYPVPRMTSQEIYDEKQSLYRFQDFLEKKYNLVDLPRENVTLYAPDVRYLLEVIFHGAGQKIEFALMDACILLGFLYTGARPGSLIATKHHPDRYATWGDVVFRPSRDGSGATKGFDVFLLIRNWKNKSIDQKRVVFQIRTVIHPKNALLDFGTMLMALAIRRGVFGKQTLDDILESKLFELRCDSEFSTRPIFCSKKSRVSLSWGPIDEHEANELFRDTLKAAGMSGGAGTTETLYSLRRGFATSVKRHMTREVAVFYLGHNANSSVLEQYYDQSQMDQNLTEGVLGPDERQEMVSYPLSILRTTPIVDRAKLTLEEALRIHPEFRHFAAKRQMLLQCASSGSSAWKEVEPYLGMSQSGFTLTNDMLHSQIARLEYRLRTLVEQVRKQRYGDESEARKMEQRLLDYQTIRERQKQSEQPSTLALHLQKLLIEQEKNLVLQDAPTSAIDNEQVYSVMPFDLSDEIDTEDTEHGSYVDAVRGNFDEDGLTKPASDTATASIPHNAEDESEILQDVNRVKITMLRNLVMLRDISCKITCNLCAQDPHTSPSERDRLWVQGTALQSHQETFHNPYDRSLRWFRSHLKHTEDNENSKQIWVYPFQHVQKIGEKCDYSVTDQQAARAHLVRYHKDDLTTEQYRSFDPTTSAEFRQSLRDLKDQEMGWDSRRYGDRSANVSIAMPEVLDIASTVVNEALGTMGVSSEMVASSSALVPDSILHELGLWRFRPKMGQSD